MANEKHIELLKQGVKAWNKWREQNPEIRPDLSESDLSSVNLQGINFARTDLEFSTLIATNLVQAELTRADFSRADLQQVNFSGAALIETKLNGANLRNANFESAHLFDTVFSDTDLTFAKNLESCIHHGPSIIDHRTIARSGKLPFLFLKYCGLPDSLIEYFPSLVKEPIQFYSCFISYSHKDEEFARRLHADLQNNNIRCWFAPEDFKIGDKLISTIDETIRVYDKLLIILSESSVRSSWVAHEVESALDKETEHKSKLFPIRIDEAVMEIKEGWAAKIRRERHIGDFRDWENNLSYQEAFQRLLRDLKAEEYDRGIKLYEEL